jgi:death on curing protein
MIQYLRIEEVIYFHDRLIEKYGGLSGLRDLGLLTSALAMPQQCFRGEELHRTLYEKAAAYMYHVIKNHAFIDGNKRTGVMASLVFLQRNGENLEFDQFILEEFAVAIAENKITKTELSILLQIKKC